MERNYGIDLLRIFSMFLIVILHALGHGGVILNAIEGTNQCSVSWFIEIFSYCAVDCFGIISGYVGFGNKKNGFSINRYVRLWLEVSFYCVIIATVIKCTGLLELSLKDLLMSPFPIVNGSYWYFTAYTGLFILAPLINEGVAGCNDKVLKEKMLLIVLIFTGVNLFVDRFSLENGYSVIWLCILYYIGAVLKKCNLTRNISKSKYLLIACLCIVFTWLVFLTRVDVKVGNLSFTYLSMISYVSPTILIVAVIYVVIFSRMKFTNKTQSIIKFMSSSSFAIYLINDNPYIREVFIRDKFKFLLEVHSYYIPFILVGFSISFCIAAILIDKVRVFLFKISDRFVNDIKRNY